MLNYLRVCFKEKKRRMIPSATTIFEQHASIRFIVTLLASFLTYLLTAPDKKTDDFSDKTMDSPGWFCGIP
jgi:short subunit fatty acids transporter